MSNVENLIKLIKENPDLEIVPMVDTEVVGDCDHAWWVAKFGKASIKEIWACDQRERVFIREEDEDELVDEEYDLLYDADISDEEAFELAEKKVAAYDWKKVIAVNIHV